jgi:hypothetical protein
MLVIYQLKLQDTQIFLPKTYDADTALPPWSTQGRVEKELGMGTGTEKISWQWCGGQFAGGSGRIARSHRRR